MTIFIGLGPDELILQSHIDKGPKQNIEGILNDFIEKEDTTSTEIFIGSEFGVGKSYFVTYYAAKIALKWLTERKGYIPILIRLRDGLRVHGVHEIENYVENFIEPKLGSYDKLLYILDGVDEYKKSDLISKVDNLRGSKVKTILTSRSNVSSLDYYYDQNTEFRGDYDAIGPRLFNCKQFVRLLKFNKDQANEYLSKHQLNKNL